MISFLVIAAIVLCFIGLIGFVWGACLAVQKYQDYRFRKWLDGLYMDNLKRPKKYRR
jgi:hypothetical protein